ncbi:MAG: agmatine deiminase family protein [Paludibacteraceae bacterium]|nr:agmatine deiminase family protein [Paludibacteraceae bacterium]
MKKILPAEWEKQQFIQLTWPHSGTDFQPMLEDANRCFVSIAHAILQYEELLIVCAQAEEVKQMLAGEDFSRIRLVELPSNDVWARDHAGITVFENGRPVIYDFAFNGWGLKYPACHDNLITKRLFQAGVFKNFRYKNCLHFVLEGGSIDSDGAGTILTTAGCLLSDNRNNATKKVIENRLKNYFGLERVLWLHHGHLAGDDTDGHVDTLVRFCNEQTIAYVKCEEEEDEHFEELKKMEMELQNFRTLQNEPYQLIPLPMADPVYENNERLPATYANFLIINGAVLMPTYQSPKDEIAKQQLQKAFPDRKIIGIDCRTLIKQYGSLHCVTKQFYPAKM